MTTYRNPTHALMEARANWNREFIHAYLAQMAEHAAKLAVEQYEKAGNLNPAFLGTVLGREVVMRLKERRNDDESNDTIGVLAG